MKDSRRRRLLRANIRSRNERGTEMKAIIKAPNEAVGHHVVVPNDLHTFQSLVGGYIETVPVTRGVVMVINECGKINNLPYNISIPHDWIAGTLLVVGVEGEDFCDCPISLETREGILKEWGNEK